MNLARVVSQSLNLGEDVVDRVIAEYAKASLIQLAFGSPADTIYGRIAMEGGTLAITQQNAGTLGIANSRLQGEELLDQISTLLIENGHGNGS